MNVINGKQIKDNTITNNKLSLSAPLLNSDATTKIYVDTAISAETSARISVDNSLSTALSAEASYRSITDASLSTAISNISTGVYTVIQVTGLTLFTTGWTLVSGYYEYDLNNSNITASKIVNVIPDNLSVDVVRNAEVYPATLSSSGSVKIYAKIAPTDNIGVTINIF